ncbi:MAG: 30S ribosomal protein S1 [Actinomycetota bacterium]|nr:30S ribosomal protein S1 [Actinomycetota bacterium]
MPNGVTENDIGGREELARAYEETIKAFDDGDLVAGKVVRVDKDEVLLDIGYKSEGVIPARELSIKHDVDPREIVHVGDEIEALVTQKEDKEGRLILSVKKARYERAWGQIEKTMKEDGVVTGTVIEVVKGGLILDIGLRGFLPASLVDLRRVRDLHPFIGKQLECKIIELDRNRNNVVLSRRKYLEEAQSEGRKDFLQKLQKGDVKTGSISSIVNFGAFVDLGGVDGLIHVSELSWKHVEHPSEVVTVGQEVTVEVLDVDLERERISLSLKKQQEDPWHQFAREHEPNEILDGEVTKLVPFGAFVRVGEGVEGLVHISELSDKHVETAEQVVTVGQKVQVKIIEIDGDRRRISLSIRQAMPGGGERVEDEMTLEPDKPADAEEPAAPARDVLEAAMAPEVETPATPEAGEEAPSVGDETIESIIADLKKRTQGEG